MFGRLYIFGGACLQGQTYGNGSIELQGVATPKGYSFNIQLRTAELQPGQPFSCSLRATVGNEILFEANSLSFATYPGGIFSGSYPSFSYLPGYSSRFDVFSQADSIYANESAGFRVFAETDCSGTLWQPADSIHFKIIEGDDLGTFVDASNRTLGAEVTMLADDFSANLYQQKVRFIANGPAAMNGGIVTVQGISGEVISTTSFKVNKTTLNLLVEWAPGELYYGEEGYIRVQTVRPDAVPSPPARTVTYTYSILTGNSCAFLFRGATESDTITAPNFSGQGTIGIRARQDSVAAVTPVQVRVTPSDGTISPANVTLNIVPSPLLILVSPTARYGDTLQVEVRRKQSSNDTVGIPLASNAFIGYQIFRSLNAGYFTTLDGSKAGDEIYGENRKALFIAAEESPQPDSVQVQFAVTVLDEGSGPESGLRLPLAGVGKIIVVLTKNEILLGETKYYYVADVDGRPKIKETTSTSVPEDAMPDFEWGEEPVEAVESGPNSGKKLAVYWEKKKPDGTSLPVGMIRLVGRYWHADSVYKVRLSAADAYGETVSTVIEVKKPAELGDNSIARSRRIYLDIEGKPIDVDSLCVFYGGIHGIPPQLIKGQIQEECAFSQALQKLVPSYRFEPYTEQLTIYNKSERYGNNPFFVRGPWDTQMGTGKCIPSPQCPPEHRNVSFIPYILYPKTLWDFVYDYSQLVTIDPPRGDITAKQHLIYGARTADGKMDFGITTYGTMQIMYDQLFELYDDQLRRTDKARAADLARQLMASRMRDQWNGVGWKNIAAQTRIASSYGLLQMHYRIAVEERKYPAGSENRPEDINVTRTCMDFSMKHLDDIIKRVVRSKLGGKQNDWSGGFEGAFRDYIYPRWNPKTAYPQTVLSNSLNHMPKP
jgi:hypothetical protein